jgi:hypothetical protein
VSRTVHAESGDSAETNHAVKNDGSPQRWLQRHFILLATLLCLAGYVYAYTEGIAGTPIRSDAFSYYVYLPSFLLYHDVTLQAVADDCCGGEFPTWTGMFRWPRTHRWVNVHPIGEAILIAPFFAAAHLLTRWTNLTPDGYTPYYQHAAGLAGLFYVVFGLWCLRRLLLRHFSSGVTEATLATLLFGTSLFHYATFDSTWSHAFSFALFSLLLDIVDRLTPGRGAVAIGILSGLIVLVRHTNVMIPVAVVAALVMSGPSDVRAEQSARGFPRILSRGLRFQAHGVRFAATAAIVAAIVILPQVFLYQSATHRWLVNSYGGNRFTFLSPHVADVLVSPQRGLFFWAPVLAFAVAGLFMMPASLGRLVPAAIAILVLDIYLIASWVEWQFGASYGHRGFVDVYPLFALGLASFYARIAPRPVLRRAIAAVVVVLCALSIFQMLQYWHGVLPMIDITWREYRSVFLRPW